MRTCRRCFHSLGNRYPDLAARCALGRRPTVIIRTSGLVSRSENRPQVLMITGRVTGRGSLRGAVRVRSGAGEAAAVDDEVLVADGLAGEVGLQDLPGAGGVAGLRGERRSGDVRGH